jgi:tetratricopeptide (TPR) repeat protein
MKRVLLMCLLGGLLAGCQTDKKGIRIDLSQAVRAYRQSIDRKPDRAQMEQAVARLSAEQLNDMGVIYEREGRLDRAEWAYQHSVWRNPRFAIAYVNLGNVLRAQGKTEEALFRYRQAMSADRANFDAANNFADLCAEKRVHLDEALERLEPVAQSPGPHRAYGLDTLGWLYHLAGDDARAVETLHAALADPRGKDSHLRLAVHEHLAAVYGAMGRHAEAKSQQAAAEAIRKEIGVPGGTAG